MGSSRAARSSIDRVVLSQIPWKAEKVKMKQRVRNLIRDHRYHYQMLRLSDSFQSRFSALGINHGPWQGLVVGWGWVMFFPTRLPWPRLEQKLAAAAFCSPQIAVGRFPEGLHEC